MKVEVDLDLEIYPSNCCLDAFIACR